MILSLSTVHIKILQHSTFYSAVNLGMESDPAQDVYLLLYCFLRFTVKSRVLRKPACGLGFSVDCANLTKFKDQNKIPKLKENGGFGQG